MSKKIAPQSSFSLKSIKIVLGLTALLLYLGTTGFQYTMDDDIFFLRHKAVQKGLSGTVDIFTHGSMEQFDGTKGAQAYRPVCLMVFALEKQFFGQTPGVSHLINVFLYSLLAVLLFNLLLRLFKGFHPYFTAAVTLLFILHPLHTEVVASVKSRDELLAGIFCLLTWSHFLRFFDVNDKRSLIKALGFFTLASFTKESSIAFIAILPLSIILFREIKIKEVLLFSLPFVAVSALYVLTRVAITGTENQYYHLPILTNILTATHGFNETMATKLVILWYHVKLVMFPWPLSWDYSFNQIPIVNFSAPLPWLALVAYLGLLITAIYNFKKQPVLSFGILFFLIVSSPTNNFFIMNVTTFAERLLFLPSIGMCVALTYLLGRFTKTNLQSSTLSPFKGKFPKLILSIGAVYAILTFMRTPDWKDNLSIFRSGVEACPNSSRTQSSLASELVAVAQKTNDPVVQRQLLQEADEHFKKSLEILPKNYQAHYNYGVYLSNMGDTAKSIQEYKTVIEQEPEAWEAMTNLGVIYEAKREMSSAFYYYKMAYATAPEEGLTFSNLSKNYLLSAQRYAAEGRTDSALIQYKNNLQMDPGQIATYCSLADLFASIKRLDSALVYINSAYQLDAANVNVLDQMAELYCLNLDFEKGLEYAMKALSLDPMLPKSLETAAKCQEGLGHKEKAAEYRKKLNEFISIN